MDSALPTTSVLVVVSLMPYHTLWVSAKSGVKYSCVLLSQLDVPVTAAPGVEQLALLHDTSANVEPVSGWFIAVLKSTSIEVAVETLVAASAGTVKETVGWVESTR